jgi:hypothetical protein
MLIYLLYPFVLLSYGSHSCSVQGKKKTAAAENAGRQLPIKKVLAKTKLGNRSSFF